MDFVELTAEQRRSFAEDGFLVVSKALTGAEVERLTEAGDRLAGWFLDEETHFRLQHSKRRWAFQLDQRPGLFAEPALVDLVTHPTTVPLVVQLLGPNLHLHSTALLYKKPEPPDYQPYRGWHRDIRIPRDLGHRHLPLVGIKICYCLTDYSQPNSGMTLMARGSHLKDEPLVIPEGTLDPPDEEVCELRLEAGDAVLFENRIFHSRSPNLSDHTAKVFMFGYAYRWMKPEVYLNVLDDELLARVDPITRQLLGGCWDIDDTPDALLEWAERHGVRPPQVPWHVEARPGDAGAHLDRAAGP